LIPKFLLVPTVACRSIWIS